MRLKDVDNIKEELNSIDNRIGKLTNLFIALGLDYTTYIDIEAKQDKIFELRDNVLFRFFASEYHLKLLIDHIRYSDMRLTDQYRKSNKHDGFGLHINHEILKKETYSLFDSFIFHLTSLFDYISNMTEYCCVKNKSGTFKWPKLARSVRGTNNSWSDLPISKTIDRIDREFVGRIYDHRSFVIHDGSSTPGSNFSIDLMNAICESKYLAPKKLTNRFSELKLLSKDYDLSLEYVLFWIMNKSIESVEHIIFDIKATMEKIRKHESGHFFFKDKSGEFLPPSTPYWRGYEK